MSGINVQLEPSPTVRRVEQAARECIEECVEQLGADSVALPVPVERWIEHPLGIQYGISDLSAYGPDVLGATFIESNEILVSETLLKSPARLRFTAAHELGHFRLHGSIRTSFHETATVGPGSPLQIERQADRFAAAFLMPLDHVMPSVTQALNYFDLDPFVCTVILSEDCSESEWLWRHRVLPRLTTAFEVSLAAMVHRLTELRLPDGRPVLPPRFQQRLLRTDATSPDDFTVRGGLPVPRTTRAGTDA
ncbi:MAG: ImmA/IrrE family metallo-endopeptidase [Phycisphaerales bacterium]